MFEFEFRSERDVVLGDNAVISVFSLETKERRGFLAEVVALFLELATSLASL